MYGFEAPKIIEAEVFATLPEDFRRDASGPRSATRQSKGGTTLEGPSFDRDGNLYFTDIPHGRIFRAGSDGNVALIAEYEGEPNGLRIHQDGRIFVADHHHGLMQLDAERGTLALISSGPEKERFKGVNDLVFTRTGDLYFTDQGATGMQDPTGAVYCLTVSGELRRLISNIPSPNGLVFNDSETILYVAATRSSEIWMLPLTAKGGVSRAGVFARLPGGGPDGLAMDVEGNIAVAHPSHGCVWLFNRRGVPIYRVVSPVGSHLTNIAYGGPDNSWLYMTEGDSFSVLRAKMPFPGRALFSHS